MRSSADPLPASTRCRLADRLGFAWTASSAASRIVRRKGALEDAFPEGRLDRALPRSVVFLEQTLGRGPASDDLVEGGKVAALVAAGLVASSAGPQARMGERERVTGDI